MSKKRTNEKEIFEAAVRLKTPGERVAYLDSVCADDPEHKARILALLQAHESGHPLLDLLIEELELSAASNLTEVPGCIIGRYKLLEKLGEGGMAVVYMAEQQEPIRRKVALKIIKLGMDTRQVIARFEAERQALAMMDHPSIAKVLDAGATETGRPYFVMELVQGLSITEYCDKNNLSTKDRLALFIQVCNAVQHAHQKGIIHRDIKPSNVMVTHHDGRAIPKVIDFGIAKATNQRLTEKTLFTRYAHIIGTPAYMSPEQAELSDLDIDTRTDIYSLGVLLYELLTGTTPFSEEELRKAGYIEMQRVIREQEPVKPSTKLSTLGETLTDIAKHRGCTPDLLRKAVRGDLDWIVMKSLEKDRVRRYEAANGLAEDIRRHVEHEPVLARGPGTAYRLQKFLRRHRVQVMTVLVLAALVVVTAMVFLQWNRSRRQLAETEGLRYQAEGLRHKEILSQAQGQYATGERQAALETIQPILNSGHVGPEARLLQAGILVDNRRPDEAVTILDGLLGERPEIAGAAHSLLARILWESQSAKAEKIPEIEAHRGQAEALLPETADAHFLRAMTAVTVQEQLVALDKALRLDPKHYESHRLRAFTYYASRKYEPMNKDAVAMEILRDRDPLGYSLRAIALRELGRYEDAIAEYDHSLELTDTKDPQYLELATQRLETLLRQGDYARVIADAQDALTLWPDKAVFRYHLFGAMTALGDYDKASVVFEQIVASGQEARQQFRGWCATHVFDNLQAGRSWHPGDREPAGVPFLPMVESEETYRVLSAKGRRITTGGFSAQWSPDGKKLAFSLGVQGRSGIGVFDPATRETDLLIVPGKYPRWSPDRRYIAFVRDRQFLSVPEFVAADPRSRQPASTDEEVWLMNADGTEPRRLVRGVWPSWSQDSACVYYKSRSDNTLYSISAAREGTEPKRIAPCPGWYPSVSPDNQRMASIEGTSLKVKDLASQALAGEWPLPGPSDGWGASAWSPDGNELCLGGSGGLESRTGLWIYHLDRRKPAKVLDGPITVGSWSPDRTKLVFELGAPHFEIWTADLDPNVSTAKAFGPARDIEEHLRDVVAFHTRRIAADPLDAYAYSDRARYYDCLHDQANANADMRRWSAAASGRLPCDFRRVIDLPFDCELVFSAERPVNTIPMMSVAFGQKGRCEMKLFDIPMVVTSLVGLCFLTGLETPPAQADFTFGEPTNLGPSFNTSVHEYAPCLSPNGLELYFSRGDVGDMWVARRASPDGEWGEPANLGPIVNSSNDDGRTSLSADGLSLYFDSARPSGNAPYDLWMTTRTTVNDDWGPPINLGPTVNAGDDWAPCISADGLELYFTSNRSDGFGADDLWVTTRATVNDDWSPPVNLGAAINTPYSDSWPCLSADGLLLFLVSNRPGGVGSFDIYMARRATKKDPWGTPVNLGPKINSGTVDHGGMISADGSTLYFDSMRPGGFGGVDLWQVSIAPILDFNGDEKVDIKDLLRLIESWGTNDPSVDIGPYAWGDGMVDEKDLEVLMSYWGQEILSPDLAAYWRLDEADSLIAADSVGDYDGELVGNPIWQPSGGKIRGALQLDGEDDYVKTGFVLSPATKAQATGFSVFAWVKDGGLGQAILSQAGGVNWLSTDQDGRLTTDLKVPGRFPVVLRSPTVITDGQWHRVGVSVKASTLLLYLDGVEVAKDVQTTVASRNTGLYIGVGKNLEPGTFWSGLIDDVRIYNRAVKP